MTTWTLSTLGKKSVVKREFWHKDGKIITREEGLRYGEFYCENETNPDINLDTPGDYNLSQDEYDWKLSGLMDSCWVNWEFSEDLTEEEIADIKNKIAGDYIVGFRENSWILNNVEYILKNPLERSDYTNNSYLWE
jgi:hypothetical protein